MWLKAGDTVTIDIEKIGALTHPVIDEKPSSFGRAEKKTPPDALRPAEFGL